MSLLNLPCPWCDSPAQFPWETTGIDHITYRYNNCANCKTLYLCSPITDEELANAYSCSYYGGEEKKFVGIIERVVRFFRKGRSKRVIAFAEKPKPRILDIGCGNGEFIWFLSKLGADAWGQEIPGTAYERSEAKLPGHILKGSLLTLPTIEKKFDGITLWHVFEHLPSPLKHLDKITELLSDDGFVALSLPNSDSYQARVFKDKWFHLDPPRHLHLPPPQLLINEMRNRGFTLIRSSYWSAEQNIFGILQSALNVLSSKRDALYEDMKSSRYPTGSIPFLLTFLFFGIGNIIATPFALIEAIRNKGGTYELWFKKSSKLW